MALTPDAAKRLARDVLVDSVEGERTPPGGDASEFAPGGTWQLGRYTVVGRLGTGGMGEVFRAVQEHPHREVALKLVRPELISSEARRRFEHEARVLARLQHPGIAQIFDAGEAETDAGPRPYFAMELVEGRPLTLHAADAALGVRAKLGLFLKVCDAVEHAHRKGVVHRDLKPTNILVTAAGEPKVLDFGVARMTDSDVQVTTLRTDIGKLIGTIPYMSPEQAAGEADELDTRSDVYSLGVVLYELLAGRLPYELGKRPIPEAVRVVKEEEPAPLSSVSRVYRGDLETIAGKALEKERERRYQSVGELAGDVRRFLSDEAIVARPASAVYQIRKFARRNRAIVATISAAGFAATLFFAATVVFAFRESVARQRAEVLKQAEADARTQAEAREADALQEAANAKAVSEFVQRMFSAAQPENTGRDLKVMDLLRAASVSIANEFADHPETAVMLRNVIAQAYMSIGDYPAAEQELRAAETLAKAIPEGGFQASVTQATLGTLLYYQGKPHEAEAVFRRHIELIRGAPDVPARDMLKSLSSYTMVLMELGRNVEAAAVLEEARSLAAAHDLLGSQEMWQLAERDAMLRRAQGDYSGAEQTLRSLVEEQVASVGEDHLFTIQSREWLANILAETGRAAEAAPILESLIESHARVLGEDHPRCHIARGNFAGALRQINRSADAEQNARQAWESLRRLLGDDHGSTLSVGNTLALAVQDLRRYSEAEEILRSVVRHAAEGFGEDHHRTATYRHNLALVLGAQGKDDEAIPLLERTVEWRDANLGNAHPATRVAKRNLARTLRTAHRLAEAEAIFAELIAHLTDPAISVQVERAWLRAERAVWLRMLERYEESERELLDVLAFVTNQFGEEHPRTLETRRVLHDLYTAWGRPDEAAAFSSPQNESTPDVPGPKR